MKLEIIKSRKEILDMEAALVQWMQTSYTDIKWKSFHKRTED
jgi:hypothetical protein